MSAWLPSNWRAVLAASLIAAGIVVGLLGRADEPARPAAPAAICAEVAPCLRVGASEWARTGPGERTRMFVAIVMGCPWEPCGRG